ncbi:TPA: prolyl oligopeptidase family serine peptidase [Pseudomonas aeruginosa]|nr:prolyl oligopeptidase family serine peptidase [Pseudomonas aeruginosa]
MHRFARRYGVLVVVLVLGLCSTTAWAGGFNKTYERITSFDGTELGAMVLVPTGQGSGPFPLVVMPASWSLPNLEYVGRATQMASQGYVVVSYTSRGFWDSTGQIDVAGPATVEDVSSVIDWALAHTPADPARIGASGISYGAGTSLLAAARDPRIKAVAALSGWADLEASLYANRTVSQQAVLMLAATGNLTGRPGSDLQTISAKVAVGDFDGAVNGFLPQAASRGAVHEVAQINRNGTAVLLANAFNDGLFPPSQYVAFYNQLTGPRRLVFSQGDHATAELPGALGLPNAVYDEAVAWFDHFLKGQANGVDGRGSVRLTSIGGRTLDYASWAQVQTDPVVYGLGRPTGLLRPTGTLSSGDATGWSASILTGIPTLADSGVVLLSGLLQAFGQSAQTSIPLVSRVGGAVWSGPVLDRSRVLAGAPSLRVTVTPSQSHVTLVAYLYRMDALGTGTLLSYKPYSLRDAVPGQARTLEIALEAAAAEIPAGSRLVLVVDTLDPRYTDATDVGGSVAFGSPASAPSRLSVPLR